MSTEAWRDQVRRDAVAAGWPAEVAAALARHVGADRKAAPKRRTTTAALPRASVSATVSLDRAVTHLFGLPQAIVADFKAAGLSTAAAAAPLLRDYLSFRNRAAGMQALQLRLLAAKHWKK